MILNVLEFLNEVLKEIVVYSVVFFLAGLNVQRVINLHLCPFQLGQIDGVNNNLTFPKTYVSE